MFSGIIVPSMNQTVSSNGHGDITTWTLSASRTANEKSSQEARFSVVDSGSRMSKVCCRFGIPFAALRVFPEIEYPLDELLSMSAIVRNLPFCELCSRWLTNDSYAVAAWG
jgi:hypothetical protein